LRIWIDLANSPHVLFFAPLIEEFRERGHEVVLTARDFAQTIGLLRLYRLAFDAVGSHGGRGTGRKLGNLIGRARALSRWARESGPFDKAISHNSYAQIVAARLRRIPAVTLMDYEHQPANHIAFRLARRVIVPAAFEQRALRHYGAKPGKVRRYDGLKEEVYLSGFSPDPAFPAKVQGLFERAAGYDPQRHLLFLVRPAATMSAYHNFENPLVHSLIRRLQDRSDVRTILLPRTQEQLNEFEGLAGGATVIPGEPLDGRNAVWHADAVISAGGTMCREAAVLGTPAFTVFRGEMGGVDRKLISEGRLINLRDENDFALLPEEKADARAKVGPEVKLEVVELCLER
jgi:predicted glycosyltransferase